MEPVPSASGSCRKRKSLETFERRGMEDNDIRKWLMESDQDSDRTDSKSSMFLVPDIILDTESHCCSEIGSPGGKMNVHFRQCHPNNEQLLSSNSKPPQPSGSSHSSTSYSDVGPTPSSREIDVQLLKFVCNKQRRFDIVEGEEFRQFVEILNPDYELPSGKALSQDILESVYSETVEKIKVALRQVPAVSVTIEEQTNAKSVTYFYAVRVHFVCGESGLKTALLDCHEFSSNNHTVDGISEWLNSVFHRFGIESKVCAYVTGDPTNSILSSAIDALGLERVPCFAHALSSVVGSALESSVKSTVVKIRKTVQFLKSKKYDLPKNMTSAVSKLKRDSPSKWETTYTMLKKFCDNKEAIVALIRRLGDRIIFEQEEWDLVKRIVRVLGPFLKIYEEISAPETVSLSKIGIVYRGLRRCVEKNLEEDISAGVRQLGTLLIRELNERLGAIESCQMVRECIFVDPRFKARGFAEATHFDDTRKGVVVKVKGSIEAFRTRTVEEQQTNSKESSIWDEFDEEFRSDLPDPMSSAVGEVNFYSAERYLPREMDPLAWWHDNRSAYPGLYELARSRLCIPATCHNGIFSRPGQLKHNQRSEFTSDQFAKVVFINNNGDFV